MPVNNKLKNTVKHPTSIIIRGEDLLGIEIAKSLLEQGGAVIIIDKGTKEVDQYLSLINSYELLTIMDFSGIDTITRELRRLDYVFYLDHQLVNFEDKISTQEFLQASNYLDAILDLTAKFDAKFLLTTSIKAHQQVIASKNIDLNFNSNTEEKYSIYTELDIQRYAESLVKEYQEKVGIDARILRLGTLLGKGMELNIESSLIDLIISAIKNEALKVPGDGLESDFYIHYLDAAYGIIKAQFTPNTKGKIFSCANEEEIPLLSVAYKLLEIYPNCQEINFDNKNSSLPPLKFYKPAPNLSSIGWKPRVSFERALAQTVSFLEEKIRTLPNSNVKELNNSVIPIPKSKKKNIFQKILNFFFVPEEPVEEKQEVISELNTQGALARLIAERKTQAVARQGNIILANNKLKDSLNKNEKGSLKRMNRSVNNSLISLRRRFDFLKNMTLVDLFFAVIAIIGVGIIYFQVISPALSLTKNIYLISDSISAINKSSISMNYEDAKNNSIVMKTNAQQAQERLTSLEFAFILLQKIDVYKSSQIILTDTIQYSTALENIYTALSPFGKYLSEYKPNIIYRFDNSKYLSVENNSDYQIYLQQIANNKLLLNIGVNSLEKVKDDLLANIGNLGGVIQENISPKLKDLNSQYSNLENLSGAYEYIPYILGKDATKKVAILLQDNLQYSDGGGNLVGYVLLSLKNGVVNDIKMVNLAKTLTRTPAISDSTLNNLKFTTVKDLTASTIQVKDLSLIMDKNLFYSEIQKVIELNEDTKIDLLVSVNTDLIKDLLHNDKISLNSVEINEDNYISSINLLIGDLKTVEHRNDILINIFAKLFEKYGNNLADVKTIDFISNTFGVNTTSLYSSDLIIKKYINSLNSNPILVEKYFTGVNSTGTSLTPSKSPNLTLTGKITINKDRSEAKNFTLNMNGLADMQNATFCGNGVNTGYKYTGVDSINYTQVFSSDQNNSCSIFLPDDDQTYQVSYTTLPFDNKFETGYNKIIQLESPQGLEVNYDIEVQFEDTSLNITTSNNDVIKNDNLFIFRGSYNGLKQIIFDFK